jgi:hypothetical protein
MAYLGVTTTLLRCQIDNKPSILGSLDFLEGFLYRQPTLDTLLGTL